MFDEPNLIDGNILEVAPIDETDGQIMTSDGKMEIRDDSIEADDDLDSYIKNRLMGTVQEEKPVEGEDAEKTEEVKTTESEDAEKLELRNRLRDLELEKTRAERKAGNHWAGYPEEIKSYYEKELAPAYANWAGGYTQAMVEGLQSVVQNSGLVDMYQKAKGNDLFLDDSENQRFVKTIEGLMGHFDKYISHNVQEMNRGINHFLINGLEESWYMSKGMEEQNSLIENRISDVKSSFVTAIKDVELFDKDIVKDAWDEFSVLVNREDNLDANPKDIAKQVVEKYARYVRKGKEMASQEQNRHTQISATNRTGRPKTKTDAGSNEDLESYIKKRMSGR